MKEYQSLSHTRWDCKFREVWGATEELHGRALLGSRILCLDGWIRREYCSSLHPQLGRRGRAVWPNEACHGISRQGWLVGLWAPLRRSPSQATGFAGGI
jgi:hypothetical protein